MGIGLFPWPNPIEDSSRIDHALSVHKADEGTKSKRIYKPDTWEIEKRKAFFYLEPTPKMERRMRSSLEKIYQKLESDRPVDDCWLHSSPPMKRDGRARSSITVRFQWNNHRYDVNIGNVALVINRLMTEEQREGIIYHRWHASHLCGNRICVNHLHFTVESAADNLSRNICFLSSAPCYHSPPCKRDRKRSLLLTQFMRNKMYDCITTIIKDDPDPQQFWAVDYAGCSDELITCGICKEPHLRARVCFLLTSRAKIDRLLDGFAKCADHSGDKAWAVSTLEKIKGDLAMRARYRLLSSITGGRSKQVN